jgi:hypothetical protein
MSEHGKPTVKPADDPAFQLPSSLAALWMPLSVGGLIALLVGWGIGYRVDPRFGMSAYLTAFMYCLSITLGALFFVLIQHLSRAGWSAVVRRVGELMMVMVIPLAILFLPIIVTLLSSDGLLYRWDDPQYATVNHLPADAWAEKVRWLNQGWFTLRAIVYFAIWAGLAIYFFRGSVEQDETGEKATTDRMQFWSGPGVILFSGTTTLAAFDWVMSLSPMWFSTMFGVYIFAGGILSAHCALVIACFVLQKYGAMRDEVTVEHYHDLGKYIFGFITFWTYIAFSQYMLIWYANIPEETEWIWHRQLGVWGGVGLVLIFCHWMLPFLGTMSRHVRRNPTAMFGWSVFILVVHFIDLYWLIMPEAHGIEAPSIESMATAGGALGVLCSILCVVGMATLMIGLILRVAGQTKIVAVRDPRLAESISFENI